MVAPDELYVLLETRTVFKVLTMLINVMAELSVVEIIGLPTPRLSARSW